MTAFLPVCPLSALSEGAGRTFRIGQRDIAVFLVGGEPRALSDRCPHNGHPLHDGEIAGTTVRCRWHGWEFDLATGRPPGSGATDGAPCVRVYPVRVLDGMVEVEVETAPA